MRIQTNTAANSALGYMRVNTQATERSIQKLSSGFRINRAGDDAAGLAIANKLRSDARGLSQAQKNVAQGSSMLQVMDGATQTVSTIIDRMKELATQANSANVGNQADKLQKEFVQLRGEIDRIVGTTNYQGSKLLDGTFGKGAGKLPALAAGAPAGTAAPEIGAGSFLAANMSGTGRVASVTVTDSAKFNGNVAFSYTAYAAAVAGPPAVPAVPATLTATMTLADGTTRSQTLSGAAGGVVNGAGDLNFTDLGLKITKGSGFTVDDATAANNGLLSGSTITFADAGTGSFQVSSSGAYGLGDNDQIQVNAVRLSTDAAGLNLADLDISATGGAATALTRLDKATDTINVALGNIGAAQSRFDVASTNVSTMLQNTQAAESTIRDADMAYEMSQFTKNNILQQAAQSMLSQANQGTQGILQLLRG